MVLNYKELIGMKESNQTNEMHMVKIVATSVSHQSNDDQNLMNKYQTSRSCYFGD